MYVCAALQLWKKFTTRQTCVDIFQRLVVSGMSGTVGDIGDIGDMAQGQGL